MTETANEPNATLPLEGLRVLDLSRIFAMPYMAGYLADLGAEVIRVEACHLPDSRLQTHALPNNEAGDRFWEQSGVFHTLNRGKRSLTLDLRKGEALDILKRLIPLSDVVIENYTPRVSRRFGLDYTNIRRLRNDIIVVSNTGYGHSGPWSNYGGVASTMESIHGTGAYMTYDGVPSKIGNSYTDFIASWTALFAIMAAIIYRARTSRGLWIDLAMYQAGAAFMGEGILDYAFNGRRGRPQSNKHMSLSPYGCYPCQGQDEWVVLAVQDDVQWKALCSAIGQPYLSYDPRYRDQHRRLKRQREIDAIIGDWTRKHDKYQVMHWLQAVGIPSGPVLTSRDLFLDPHFKARGFFESVKHSHDVRLDWRPYLSRGWRFSEINPKIQGPGPDLGEGNLYVLQGILGLSPGEIELLVRNNVIGTKPLDVQPPHPLPLQDQVATGGIQSYDKDFREVLELE